MPPKHDHYGLISEELEKLMTPSYLEDLFPDKWEHLAGLTHNYALVMGGKVPNHKVDIFKEYNKMLLTLPIAQSQQFLPFIQKAASLS